MTNYTTIITSIIAGSFALAAAYFAWKLKNVSEGHNSKRIKEKDKENLYTEIIECFEGAIRNVKTKKQNESETRFLKLNAKVALLAPEKIHGSYLQCAHALEEWSILFHKSSPRTQEINGHIITTISSPDPTAKYKEPERESFTRLQELLVSFIKEMKGDIE